MTKSEFRKNAFPVQASILGVPLSIDPVQNKTGSSGWRKKCAVWVKVGPDYVRVLCHVQMTVVKSKEWKP